MGGEKKREREKERKRSREMCRCVESELLLIRASLSHTKRGEKKNEKGSVSSAPASSPGNR